MFQMQAPVHWLLHNAQTSVKAVEGSQWPPATQVNLNCLSWHLELGIGSGHIFSPQSLSFEAKRGPWWGWTPDRASLLSPAGTMDKKLHIQDTARASLCQDKPLGRGWQGQEQPWERSQVGLRWIHFKGRVCCKQPPSGRRNNPKIVHTKGTNEKGQHLLVCSLLYPS